MLTDAGVDALILECNLIKKYRPYYNIRLRDDKHYPFLKVTINEAFPRVLITRSVKKDGGKYYGPFTSSGAVHETLRLLKKLFPLRNCKLQQLGVKPKATDQVDQAYSRPCLNHHIKRCLAPCAGLIEKAAYQEMVKEVCLFLEGRHETLIKELEQKMHLAADDMQFEQAAKLRDQIKALTQIAEQQKIVSSDLTDQDIIAMARGFDEACVMVFFVRTGKMIGCEPHILQGTDDLSRSEVIEAFVKQFYSQVEFIPQEILLDETITDLELVTQWLTQKRGAKVTVQVPKRGNKKALVEMVAKNALQELEQHNAIFLREKAMTEGAVLELQQALQLPVLPQRMECYDISNTQGTESVGSMVVFEDGKPNPQKYRRFKIKTVEGPNDFASMQEVLGRRFKNTKWALPDIVIIDGGKGQLGVAREIMYQLGVAQIPTFGLAKAEEQLFTEGNPEPIILPRNSKALYLVQRIRDEAHRFALAYHRKLRSQRNLHSVLEDIQGIGSKRKQALYKHFGSLTKIRQASVKELTAVPGMNKAAAREVWDFFQAEGSHIS